MRYSVLKNLAASAASPARMCSTTALTSPPAQKALPPDPFRTTAEGHGALSYSA